MKTVQYILGPTDTDPFGHVPTKKLGVEKHIELFEQDIDKYFPEEVRTAGKTIFHLILDTVSLQAERKAYAEVNEQIKRIFPVQ